MRQSSFLSARVWLVVPLLALGFTVWFSFLRIQRIEHIAALTRGESVPSASSLTGYAGGIRERVLPDHDNRSYEWIAQTQHMLARGEWRARHIPDENAPFGRENHAAAPYRWWLGFVAWIDRQLSDLPNGLSVERAAIDADPLLHLLILTGITLFAVRYAGALPASLGVLGGAFLFPFAARFFPGVPDDATLEVACALGSLLPLLAGLRELDSSSEGSPGVEGSAKIRRAAPFWFSIAGIFGGCGFWISPASQVPLTVGIGLGALLASWVRRPANENERVTFPLLWRLWSLSGAIMVLAASLIEYYPEHLGAWELRAVHPLYGLGWIGGGELLARITGWIQQGGASWKPRDVAIKLLALLAVLAVPLVMYKTGNPGFLAVDGLFFRLTNQPGGIMAPNLAGWIRDDGFTPVAWATLLPLLLLGPALWVVARRQTGPALRGPVAIALGPVALALVPACFQIRQWLLLDATLLVLLLVTTRAICADLTRPLRCWLWIGAVVLVLLPGVFQLVPSRRSVADNVLALPQVVGLVERDLAHWLAKHSGSSTPSLVLAPPSLTTSLNYYGGLRGVGTLSWENQDGLSFAIRIAISTSRSETAALLRQRGVTHLVLPSWDPFFDSYIHLASVQVGELLYPALERWDLPAWLKPLPYQLPSIPGFENQSVKIFEVVDDQDAATAASHLTEYFIEMGQLENARISHKSLLKYPADFGVQVARAQLWAALGDATSFTAVFEPLLSHLADGADRYLPWDRRVSLAVVLSRGNRMDLARGQVQRCLAELSEARLRSLTTYSLYHLLVMNKALGLEITDAKLRALAWELLPAELRQRR